MGSISALAFKETEKQQVGRIFKTSITGGGIALKQTSKSEEKDTYEEADDALNDLKNKYLTSEEICGYVDTLPNGKFCAVMVHIVKL